MEQSTAPYFAVIPDANGTYGLSPLPSAAGDTSAFDRELSIENHSNAHQPQQSKSKGNRGPSHVYAQGAGNGAPRPPSEPLRVATYSSISLGPLVQATTPSQLSTDATMPLGLSDGASRELEAFVHRFSPDVPPETRAVREATLSLLRGHISAWAQATVALLISGSVVFGVADRDSDVDIVCVLPRTVSATHFFETLPPYLVQACDRVEVLHSFPNAQVPVMRLSVRDPRGTVLVDLLLARMNLDEVPAELNVADDSIVGSMADAGSVSAINAARSAILIRQLVPDFARFSLVLRTVRFFARQRGIYSSKQGFLGGICWTLLAAFVCQLLPTANFGTIVLWFFRLFSHWDWASSPIRLCANEEYVERRLSFDTDGRFVSRSSPPLRIIAPAPPCANGASRVTMSAAQTVIDEFARAYSVIFKHRGATSAFPELFAPRDPILNTSLSVDSFFVCSFTLPPTSPMWGSALTFLESRMRTLALALEDSSIVRRVHGHTACFVHPLPGTPDAPLPMMAPVAREGAHASAVDATPANSSAPAEAVVSADAATKQVGERGWTTGLFILAVERTLEARHATLRGSPNMSPIQVRADQAEDLRRTAKYFQQTVLNRWDLGGEPVPVTVMPHILFEDAVQGYTIASIMGLGATVQNVLHYEMHRVLSVGAAAAQDSSGALSFAGAMPRSPMHLVPVMGNLYAMQLQYHLQHVQLQFTLLGPAQIAPGSVPPMYAGPEHIGPAVSDGKNHSKGPPALAASDGRLLPPGAGDPAAFGGTSDARSGRPGQQPPVPEEEARVNGGDGLAPKKKKNKKNRQPQQQQQQQVPPPQPQQQNGGGRSGNKNANQHNNNNNNNNNNNKSWPNPNGNTARAKATAKSSIARKRDQAHIQDVGKRSQAAVDHRSVVPSAEVLSMSDFPPLPPKSG